MNRLKFFFIFTTTMAQAPPLTVSSLVSLLPHPLTSLQQQSDAVTSLLSLSIAAASVGASPSPRLHPTLPSSPSTKHHRRLASTGKSRRRLSDAREACSQPSCVISSLSLIPKFSFQPSKPDWPQTLLRFL